MAETTTSVQQVTDANFEQSVLNSGKPALVDFWAPWCGPCRIIGPIVEELAPSYQGRAVIAKMNVDDNPQVAQRYGITSIPTLMIFKDGKLVDRAVGAMPKSELQKFIDRNL
jgi:thioredoxin 1